MAQTTMVNFRMDTEAKKEVEEICSKMGLTMTAAINVFLSKVRRVLWEETHQRASSHNARGWLKIMPAFYRPIPSNGDLP